MSVETLWRTSFLMRHYRAVDGSPQNEKQILLGDKFYFPLQRWKMSAALVPPKPKEFESAYSTEAFRA